jgi:hypothetical protein
VEYEILVAMAEEGNIVWHIDIPEEPPSVSSGLKKPANR